MATKNKKKKDSKDVKIKQIKSKEDIEISSLKKNLSQNASTKKNVKSAKGKSSGSNTTKISNKKFKEDEDESFDIDQKALIDDDGNINLPTDYDSNASDDDLSISPKNSTDLLNLEKYSDEFIEKNKASISSIYEEKEERNEFTIDNEFEGSHFNRVTTENIIDEHGYKAPDLLSLQFKSFYNLFNFGAYSKDRDKTVLYRILSKFFPVKSIKDEYILDFIDYKIEPPRYTPEECIEKGISYAVFLTVKFRLISKNNVLEQDIYFGEIPYMTKSASFIYNGVERVGVMQIGKSSGISFTSNKKVTFAASNCVCKIIPLVGAWIEITVSQKLQMFVTFNKKAKVHITTFLRAIGYKTNYDILNMFNLVDNIDCSKKSNLEKCKGRKLACKILKNPNNKDSFKDVLFNHYTVLTDEVINKIIEHGDKSILVLKDNKQLINEYSILIDTLNADHVENENQAYQKIYELYLSNNYIKDVVAAKNFFHNLLENEKTFDLGYIGRKKLNNISGLKTEKTYQKLLTKDDVKVILSYFFDVINRKKDTVDIDHYGNKQLKTVGEKVYEMIESCFQKIARVAKERMNVCDRNDMNIYNLINCSILSVTINSFFATNSLLQFMDEINPLCSLMHKRRISAGGDGGIDENSASTEIRDIHYSQYGRVCPVETTESNTIGLISSLAMNAKTDNFGFLLAPYRIVKNGKVDLDNNNIVYLNADDELGQNIIPASARMNKDGNLLDDFIKARISDNFKLIHKNEVNYMDVISNEPFSVSASIIPFLENDDSSRALTGTNMLKQAVPLIKPEAPIVGTGVEAKICQDCRKVLYAENNGVVKYVDANKILIEYDISKEEELYSYDNKVKEYKITKFKKTNQDTCENYRPIVKIGQRVKRGDVLVEGFSTENGELALGSNVKVAFMTYKGYNFQDAIVISERLLRDDVFTSIYEKEFSICTKETKFGREYITRDISSLSDDKKKYLNEDGIVEEGTYVKQGDILVGKIKPKVENRNSPENKLLETIFGEKSCEMTDCSLKVPPFTEGIVIKTKLFKRRKVRKTSKLFKDDFIELKDQYNKILDDFMKVAVEKFVKILSGKESNNITRKHGEVIMVEGCQFTAENLKNSILTTEGQVDSINTIYPDLKYFNILSDVSCENWTNDEKTNELVVKLINNTLKKQDEILNKYHNEEFSLLHGDYLQDEILEKTNVTLGYKRKLEVGDKLSGRHGNKGVISKILKEEDMPFLEDGTRVDIILTPLGIPSRMNIGQLKETIMAEACKKLGIKVKSPIINGSTVQEISELCKKAGVDDLGETQLYDGETGEKFEQKCTVGIIYMIKLNHMVVDKVHARSIGQYSVVTQQPLSGRAHFGGQRFGEMEVWSLEAYGATNLLQEMLTIKSDDIKGRRVAYNSLLNGEPVFTSDVPESFNVLIRELTAIGLKITFS